MNVPPMLLLLIPLAYVAGSIPFGLIVGLTRGIDPRKAGSGNIGATNVGRLLGKKYFWLVFLLDLVKGFGPVWLAGVVLGFRADTPVHAALWLAVAFAAIIGHMFSIFLGFKGGKGVATSGGVLLGVWPYYTLPGLIGMAIFVVIFKLTRYISVASMLSTATVPVLYLCIGLWRGREHGWDPLGAQWPLLAFAVMMAGLVIYKHRSNIARLRAGTESRAVSKVPQGNQGLPNA